MAAREVFGFPEDAALRLTPGAGLEVVGMKELEEEGVEEEEEEEEEEEAAAARRARSFARDARVRFLGGRLELMLGLSAEKWSQHLDSEENRQVLGEFLENPSPACLVFSVAAAGPLAVAREVRGDRLRDPVRLPVRGQASRVLGFPWGMHLGALRNFLWEPLPWSLQNHPRAPTMQLSNCGLVF